MAAITIVQTAPMAACTPHQYQPALRGLQHMRGNNRQGSKTWSSPTMIGRGYVEA